MQTVPRPPGLPLVAHALSMRFDPLGFFERCMRRHGGLVRFEVGRRPLYLVSDPELARELLFERHRALSKDTQGMRLLGRIVGRGLLTSDGDLWRRQRRIAQPAFHKQRLAGFAQTMTAVADEVAARWESLAARGEPVDLYHEMMVATLSIVSRTLLGTDLGRDAGEVARALEFLLLDTRHRMSRPWSLPMRVPTPANRRFAREVAVIDGLLARVIDERVSGRARGDDLLQMLVDAVDEETGERMDARQLRDEVVTMFIAGHETTAGALTWTFEALARHPAARQRLDAELDATLGDRAPTLEDLPRLPWLSQVLDESLRLRPPAWVFARWTAEPVALGGHAVPAGVTILTSPWTIHRNPRYWSDPEAFDPERFAPERAATHHALQLVPFGAATRLCIGRGFALMEARLVLATLARRFRWEMVSERPLTPLPAITLRPREAALARLTLRAADRKAT
ncbi:MAG: cytochrome P450 [Deltaproteobacteria bacterium]|nr:cytochrome P450 [Deltaproteobacteria bacterium]